MSDTRQRRRAAARDDAFVRADGDSGAQAVTRRQRREQARAAAKLPAERRPAPTPVVHRGHQPRGPGHVPARRTRPLVGGSDPRRAQRPSTRRHGRTRYGLDRAAAGVQR